MASGMWTAVSGAVARAQAVDTVANNLANQDTAAFKKDAVAFKEYLVPLEKEAETPDVPRGKIRDKDFYPTNGKDQSQVLIEGTYTNFKQGNLKVTQSPLDVALDGPGFFEVSTPNGVRFTRHGSFKLAMDGRLVTSEGYPVLASQPGGLATAQPVEAAQPSQGGQLTQGGVTAESARFINLRDRPGVLTVSEQGEVYVGDELITRLSIKEFNDLNKLRKQGSQLFINSDPENVAITPVRTALKQGMIETSNVNPVEEMTNLIKANRLFDHDLKVLKTYNDLMGREVNDIGKL